MLRKRKSAATYLILLLLLLFSCQKDSFILTDDGKNYFPFEAGTYVIYDVDSIVHNDFTQTVDTFKYQIKEYFESSFLDNSNRNTIRIERYKKEYQDTIPYSAIPWRLTDVWYTNKTTTTAEKVEENQRYIKLVFPVEKKKEWDGNSYNTLGEQRYIYTDINTPREIGNMAFDSTLLITQANTENLIEKKYYVEIYSKNIGLIYKEIIDIASSSIIPGIPIMDRITSGVECKMTINSYGSN